MPRRIAVAVTAMVLANALVAPVSASVDPTFSRGIGPAQWSRSTLVQDPSWVALKDAYRVHNPQLAQADVVVLPDSCDPACPPGSYYLSTSITGTIVEPEGTGHDDHGTSYNDPNYWDFCTAGAATATLYYWKPSNVTTTNWWATGRFHEPALNNTGHSATTYWAVTDSQYGMTVHGRSYLMYLAELNRPGLRGDSADWISRCLDGGA